MIQAVRGAVKYEPHPIWGIRFLFLLRLGGISKDRFKELNPFTYRSMDEMKNLLKAQIALNKFYPDKQCPSLPDYRRDIMDFYHLSNFFLSTSTMSIRSFSIVLAVSMEPAPRPTSVISFARSVSSVTAFKVPSTHK